MSVQHICVFSSLNGEHHFNTRCCKLTGFSARSFLTELSQQQAEVFLWVIVCVAEQTTQSMLRICVSCFFVSTVFIGFDSIPACVVPSPTIQERARNQQQASRNAEEAVLMRAEADIRMAGLRAIEARLAWRMARVRKTALHRARRANADAEYKRELAALAHPSTQRLPDQDVRVYGLAHKGLGLAKMEAHMCV